MATCVIRALRVIGGGLPRVASAPESQEERLLGRDWNPMRAADLGPQRDAVIQDPHLVPTYTDRITKTGVAWFDHLKRFVDDGASAFKLDGSNQVNFHPDRKWRNGMEDAEMHNLYPLFGEAFLTCAFTDRIYLPAGRWIDYWTGTAHDGPGEIPCAYPADRGGVLFVKAGAIIPMWPPVDHVGASAVPEISLDVYPWGQSSFTLYEDDGVLRTTHWPVGRAPLPDEQGFICRHPDFHSADLP
jgi:alpha-glucosidase (family GH31 glycosyl hydrolase)